MKKVILLTVVALCLSSCEMKFMYEPTTDKHGVTTQQITSGVEKVTIEGHEYLKFTHISASGTTSLAVVHSASCPANHDKYGFGTDIDSTMIEENKD
jgi:hypothetical protein